MTVNIRALYRQMYPSGTRLVYVTAGGSDGGTGSAGSPYATISHAVSVASPGDRILVDAGTYGHTVITAQGAPGRWISIESLNDSVRPVISVADNFGNDGIDIQGASFIGLYGFEVVGLQTSTSTNPSGVSVYGGSHHVAIWNNVVHDFPGGGINCNYQSGGWDQVDVWFNTVHACCRYNPNNTSGISFYGAVDVTGTTIDHRYGFRCVGNYVYDCLCTVPFTSGGFAYVTDGNGISVDSLAVPNALNPGLAAYLKPGLVEGNIAVGNGGRGIHVYNSRNVDVFANTAAGNIRTSSTAITGKPDIDSTISGGGVTIAGNVICPTNTPNSTDTVSTYSGNVILGGTQPVPGGNIAHTSTGLAYFVGDPTDVTVVLPTSAFIPVTVDTVTRPGNSLGFQALGADPRPAVSWAAGAVEPTLPVRYLM